MKVNLDVLDKNYEHELYVTPITPAVVKALSKELRAARIVISVAKKLDDILYSFLSGDESWAGFDEYSVQLLKNSLQNYADVVGEKYEYKVVNSKSKEDNKIADQNKIQPQTSEEYPDKDLNYHPYGDYMDYGEWD